MTLQSLAGRLGKFAADNSPVILTAVAVTGTLTTAYLTGRATIKAVNVLRFEEPLSVPFTPKERIKHCWKFYIPAVTTAGLTIAAIVCANRIGTRRAAALAAAYTISEKAFEEYRSKIVEKLGAKKEQAFRDEIAQDRVTRNPVGAREVIIATGGQVLCYETFTGRYFYSDIETLRKAQNDLNQEILRNLYGSLSDFYDLVGLPHTAVSGEIGWNADNLLELQFSAVLAEDGRPCISVEFSAQPYRHYDRLC